MYPTKEEILEEEIMFDSRVIESVKAFKKEWVENNKKEISGYKINENKKQLLKELINELAGIYNKPVKVTFKENKKSSYSPLTKTININDSLSIVTAMHEFAHHILGRSEKKACQWSVWLFKKTFTKSYEKLGWSGHLLVKQEGKPLCPECGTKLINDNSTLQCENCEYSQ